MIIDGDGHFVEPPDWAEKYLSAEWRKKLASQAPAGDPTAGLPFGIGDALTPGGLKPGRPKRRTLAQAERGGFDPKERLVMHDREGIDAAVLYPTMGLGYCGIEDPEWALAACEAVNRIGADYCAASPKELYAVAALPTVFPELAARELRRCVKEYGFIGGIVRPNPPSNGRTLDNPSLEILWATAEDLDVALCIHTVSAPGDRSFAGAARARAWFFGHAMAHSIEAMYAFGEMYQGRVFDRHPRLRAGYMESGSGWPSFWVDRLHEHAEVLGWLVDPKIERLPGEVFREQCVVTAEGEDRMAPVTQSFYGDEKVLWASDYPHFDVEPPYVAEMQERRDLTPAQKDGIFRRAALRFYKLDEDAIARAGRKRRGDASPSRKPSAGERA